MSSDKREAQKKNREKAIRKAKATKSIKWIVISFMILAVLGVIGWAVASSVISGNTASPFGDMQICMVSPVGWVMLAVGWFSEKRLQKFQIRWRLRSIG